MLVQIRHEAPAYESYAAERTRGLYNIDVTDGQRFELDVEVPVEREDWQIGVVVGPSGSGKTSIARALHRAGWKEWEDDGSATVPLIDQLCWMGDYAKATAALAAVGLGSVPSWLRPYTVLSNGERFRAGLAMLLLATVPAVDENKGGPEDDEPLDYYVDEFTSVLDRQVAKVGAGAFAKQWRRVAGRRVILITPHYDILDWVQPDWVLDTHGTERIAGESKGVVLPRPGDFQAARSHADYPGDEVGTVVI